MTKPLRQWRIEGESLKRLRPLEVKVFEIENLMEKLLVQLHAAQDKLFTAVYREMKIPASVDFTLDASDPACFIAEELPAGICPGCGESHEGEHHQPTKLH